MDTYVTMMMMMMMMMMSWYMFFKMPIHHPGWARWEEHGGAFKPQHTFPNTCKKKKSRGPTFNPIQAFLLVHKLKSAPRAFTLVSQGWTRKKSFQSAQSYTNECWTWWPCIGPQGWKRGASHHGIWETNLQPLGPNNKPKMLKVGP
jgi:hypothetical protein